MTASRHGVSTTLKPAVACGKQRVCVADRWPCGCASLCFYEGQGGAGGRGTSRLGLSLDGWCGGVSRNESPLRQIRVVPSDDSIQQRKAGCTHACPYQLMAP